MADIDVVPKRGTKTWVWIVLALVVIAILWMVLGRRSPSTSGRLANPEHVVVVAMARAGGPLASAIV